MMDELGFNILFNSIHTCQLSEIPKNEVTRDRPIYSQIIAHSFHGNNKV